MSRGLGFQFNAVYYRKFETPEGVKFTLEDFTPISEAELDVLLKATGCANRTEFEREMIEKQDEQNKITRESLEPNQATGGDIPRQSVLVCS